MSWLASRLTSRPEKVTFWIFVQLKLSHRGIYPDVGSMVTKFFVSRVEMDSLRSPLARKEPPTAAPLLCPKTPVVPCGQVILGYSIFLSDTPGIA
jgi:hypothetical protein